MKQIDEEKLESDLACRFQYLAEFIGITESDLQAIHGAAGALAPLVPSLVDGVYVNCSGMIARNAILSRANLVMKARFLKALRP